MKKIKPSIFEKSLEQTFNKCVKDCCPHGNTTNDCDICHQPKEVSKKKDMLTEMFEAMGIKVVDVTPIPSVESIGRPDLTTPFTSDGNTPPESKVNNKPYKTCLNVNCPERTGGVCNAGERKEDIIIGYESGKEKKIPYPKDLTASWEERFDKEFLHEQWKDLIKTGLKAEVLKQFISKVVKETEERAYKQAKEAYWQEIDESKKEERERIIKGTETLEVISYTPVENLAPKVYLSEIINLINKSNETI